MLNRSNTDIDLFLWKLEEHIWNLFPEVSIKHGHGNMHFNPNSNIHYVSVEASPDRIHTTHKEDKYSIFCTKHQGCLGHLIEYMWLFKEVI